MITISLHQEVACANEYITCIEGEFEPYDLVPCKLKSEQTDSTCAFYAISISGENINNEEIQ